MHPFSHVYGHANFLSEHMNSLKTIREEELFSNVNLSNLENVLQRNFRTNRARKCILGNLEAKILKIYLLDANHGGAFVV